MYKILPVLLIPLFSFIPFEVTNTVAQLIPFTQNWSDAALITNDNNWSLVPGMEGFTGNDLNFGTGTDPQTLTGQGFLPSQNVIANQSSPNTLTLGGVAEFDGIANPAIALQPNGTNSANAPYIIISLNTINQMTVKVNYNLRDLDGSSDNAVQPVALQYRVGNSSSFINIPDAFVADASTGPNLAVLVTPVSTILPADVNNKPLVQLRIITADAVGNDEWIGIDDISITGSVINAVPVVAVTPGTTTYIYNSAVVIDNAITVTDDNNTTLTSANVSISNGFQSGLHTLLFTNNPATMGNIAGSFNQATGVLNLSSVLQAATLAQWQAALRSIQFSVINSFPFYQTVNINFIVNDGTSNSNTATRLVALYPSPPPVVTTTAGNTSYSHSSPVAIDNGITVSDANNATLASASISFTGSFQVGNDILSFTNNGSAMGNITGSYSTPLGMLQLSSIGATATLAQWQAALRAVRFYSIVNPPVYNRTVNFTLNDGQNNSAPATKIIAIVPGAAPVLTASTGNPTYIHMSPLAIDKGLTVSDFDGPTLLSASVGFSDSFQVGNDILSFTNNGSTMGNITGNYSQPLGILNLTSSGATATITQWQAALRSVKYYNTLKTPSTYNRNIQLTVNDGVANSNSVTRTISYLPLSFIAQSWSPAVQVVDPNTGAEGDVGSFSKIIVVNGNPALVYYDLYRGNLVFKRAIDASGSAFGAAVTVDSIGNVGQYLSVQIVNGNPAIAYYDDTNKDLKYIRALDNNGTAWGSALTIDASGDVGLYTSLQVVNGNPAISYQDYTQLQLKFIRASNATGSVWGSPVNLDLGGSSGSMQIVNGNPAIAYYDFINAGLKYIRATDVSGISWGIPKSLDESFDKGRFACLKVVNGFPAISYYDGSEQNLKYIRALDASGSDWAAPQFINLDFSFSDIGRHSSLQVINGYPAVSYYYEGSRKDLKYARATDSIGSAWGPSLTVDAAGDVGTYSCLEMINGNPAIVYKNATDGNMNFVRASDASGTGWGSPVSTDSWGNAGKLNSVQMVAGNPAIGFTNSEGDLYFVRANNSAGTSWGIPVMLDESGVGDLASIQIVNGNPAIAYLDQTNYHLKYVRASNALGTVWDAPITLDNSPGSGATPVLLTVNGNPAISYSTVTEDRSLKYIRAADATGSVWNSPMLIDTAVEGPHMQIINGRPAIVYSRETDGRLQFVRANDISGSTWNTPVMLPAGPVRSTMPSLQLVNGTPAVAYYDLVNKNLKYIRAFDSSGTNWNNPVSVDVLAGSGFFSILHVVNNIPAIAYYNIYEATLKYISAANITGSSWEMPVTMASGLEYTANISMVISGNYMGLAYFHPEQLVPYFFPGKFGFSSLATDYFRSKQNGNWNDVNSWESSPDNINWGNATLTPDFIANTITIRYQHTINVTENVTVDQLVLQPASSLITKTGNHLIIK